MLGINTENVPRKDVSKTQSLPEYETYEYKYVLDDEVQDSLFSRQEYK